MTSQPSTTPWKVVTDGFKNGFASIETEDGGYEVVLSCRHDNAEFIVKACNSHYELLAALEMAVQANADFINAEKRTSYGRKIGMDDYFALVFPLIQSMHPLIEKAKGE